MATKQEQAKFEASKNRKWYPGKNLDRMSTAIINEMTDDKPLFGKITGGIGKGLRNIGSKFGKFADKNLGTNKLGRYGLHAEEAEVDTYSRSESLEDLPTKFTRRNYWGHNLGEFDMGEQTPYEFLMNNPGDLYSYIRELGLPGKGGSTEKQNQFIKLFATQEGGQKLLDDYYHDFSGANQSFLKGSEMENQIQNALNNPDTSGIRGTTVLDLVSDVDYGRSTPVREAEFERGLEYGSQFQNYYKGKGDRPGDADEFGGGAFHNNPNIQGYKTKEELWEEKYGFPRNKNLGTNRKLDSRIEGTDEGGF